MRRLWSRWLHALDTQETGTSLALVRVGLGLAVLYMVALALAHGVVVTIWTDAAHGGYRALTPDHWLLSRLGPPGPTLAWTVVSVTGVGAALLVLGLGGRVTAFVTLQASVLLTELNPEAVGGYDRLINNALWLLVLGRATATLSLDCRLRTGRWRSDTLVSSWPRRLVALQLVVMYTFTGLAKMGATWTPAGGFTAVYTVLQDPTWRRFDMAWTASAWAYPLTRVGTAVTWLWELGAPVLLFWRRARKPFVVIGLLVHGGIFLAMDVGPFSLACVAVYPALFRGDALDPVIDRIQGLWSRPS